MGIVWGWLGLFGGGRIALARRVGAVLVVQTEAFSFGWSAVHLRPPRRRVGVGRGFIFGCKTAVATKWVFSLLSVLADRAPCNFGELAAGREIAGTATAVAVAVSLKGMGGMLVGRDCVAVAVHHATVCVVYVFAGRISIIMCCWLVCALNNGR